MNPGGGNESKEKMILEIGKKCKSLNDIQGGGGQNDMGAK